jgi:4,5:9,10-diseco-3-hydroxy-5,9,17-trioxoandrosta-1(10),2-diene-4-oate hydrolase
MLHGSGPGASGYSNFKDNFPHLEEHGYHVVVPDYVGYGLSSKPDDFIYRVENQVAILRELLAHCGVNKVSIVGNSLGGWMAFHHAINHPDEVAKLIVMAPAGMEPPEKFLPEMEGLSEMFRIPLGRDFSIESMRKLFSLFVFDSADTPDIVLEERLEIARQQPVEVFQTLGGEPVVPRLAELKIPVLALWGTRDKFVPYRHSQYLLDNIADCQLVTSNRTGHWFMIEQPELFNRECLAFLNA